MLSILIPTYNYDCHELVYELYKQSCKLNIPFEIIVADDASEELTKTSNRKINELPHCKYIELKENMGRARIRNFLGETSQYEYLLFMDCDGKVTHNNFLRNYLDAKEKAGIIIGGLSNPETLPAPNLSLRYTYECSVLKKRKNTDRNQNPFSQFTTFCFLIKRDIFLKNKFDNSFTEYGYEDVMFGRELQKNGVSIFYINNPLCHMGLDDNQVYLNKIHTSIQTLYTHKDKINENAHLLVYYRKIQRIRMVYPLSLFYMIFQNLLKKNLLSTHPNMHIFAFYKLCYLCHIASRGTLNSFS